MAGLKVSVVLAVAFLAIAAHGQDLEAFPEGFFFGTATASYQIEGSWNADGKGKNIWDYFTHTQPDKIVDGSNGDIAADSYVQFREDVRMLKELNVNTYRFSVAWSRVLPNGIDDVVNQAGIDYYNALIDELLANGITPLVKWWITFNEPGQTTIGYSEGEKAPGWTGQGVNDYIVAHTILKCHARAWHIYDEEFRQTQNGKVSITLDSDWSEPETDSVEDAAASDRGMQFFLGWFAHPIYSEEGNYPLVMRERVAANSAAAGLPQSRLPEFDAFWIDHIRGTWDFFGLNHYTSVLVTSDDNFGEDPSRYRDSGVNSFVDPSWPGSGSDWLKVVPWGFRKLLNWIATEYNNPPIFVTENGFSDRGELDDQGRIDFYVSYLREMLKAVHLDGVNVIGYTAWSLLDNFEWAKGYTEKFGIFHVDFNDPARPRTAKSSVAVIAEIARTGRIPPENPKANIEEQIEIKH